MKVKNSDKNTSSTSTTSSSTSTTKKIPIRNRIKYTAKQLQHLEKVFKSSQYPDSSILEDLSNMINIDADKLSTWFQNRRTKFKRQSKDTHVTWMRQQLYQSQGSATASHGSRDSTSQSEKRHVLSPPTPMSPKKERSAEKPKSNLHYLPSAAPTPSTRPNYEDAYNFLTSSMLPSNHNVYGALADAVSGIDSSHGPLRLAQFMTDIFQHSPSSSCPPEVPSHHHGPATVAPTGSGSPFYHNYPAYSFW